MSGSTQPKENQVNLTRKHQTAVFVRVTADISTRGVERAKRFVESLNGPQIKADIYTVFDNGDVLRGLVFDYVEGDEDLRASSPDLRDAADAAGYNATVVWDASDKCRSGYSAALSAPEPEVEEYDEYDDYDDPDYGDDDEDFYAPEPEFPTPPGTSVFDYLR